jgi:small-conductance mechanosensitive channel
MNNAQAAVKLRQPPVQQLAGIATAIVVLACIAAGLLAIAVLYAVLKPRAVRAGSDLLRGRVLRSFGLGLLTLLVLGLLAANLRFFPKPVSDWFALAGAVFLAYVVLTGFTVAAHCIGENILANTGAAGTDSDIRKILLGGGLVVLTNLLPIAGQLVTVIILICGLGVTTQAIFGRTQPPAESPATPEPEMASETDTRA